MPLEIGPCGLKQIRVDVVQAHRRAVQQSVANLGCLLVMAPTVEKRHNLIEDVRSCNDVTPRGENPLPMSRSRFVVLIVLKLERQEVAGVDEDGAHVQ